VTDISSRRHLIVTYERGLFLRKHDEYGEDAVPGPVSCF
jgi:hypothetical protein